MFGNSKNRKEPQDSQVPTEKLSLSFFSTQRSGESEKQSPLPPVAFFDIR